MSNLDQPPPTGSITLHVWDRECPGGEFRIQREIAQGTSKRFAKTMRGHQECRFIVAAVTSPGGETSWWYVLELPQLSTIIERSIRHADKNRQSLQVKPFVTAEAQEEIIAVIENAKIISAAWAAGRLRK